MRPWIYIYNNELELHDLTGIALDIVEVFGKAGLRALSNRALERADDVQIQVQAKLAEADAENAAREIEGLGRFTPSGLKQVSLFS